MRYMWLPLRNDGWKNTARATSSESLRAGIEEGGGGCDIVGDFRIQQCFEVRNYLRAILFVLITNTL
ncbi:hypothetical protein MRX96_055653 [Rhipicephalus microplus]